MQEPTITIEDVVYHRNGITSQGFHVVTFRRASQEPMVAIVFPAPQQVAVFQRRLLGRGVIASDENSWRGDVFEPALRAAIAARSQHV